MEGQIRAMTAQHPLRRVFPVTMAILLVASFFATALAMYGASAASAQAEAGIADAVPADSVLYMEANLDQTSDQWVQTYALLERAGLSDLAEQELDASPEEVGSMAGTLEFTGKAALVFTSPDAFSMETVDDFSTSATDLTADPDQLASTDVPEGFAVVFQPEDPEALYGFLQQMVADEANSAGVTVETVDHNGTTIEYWESVDEMTDPTAIALVEDTVVLAVRPDDVEPIIDTVGGTVDALSSNENFLTVRGAFDTESLSFGYMDATVIADQAALQDPELAELYGTSQAYVGWNAYADENGFRLDTVTVPAGDAAMPAPASFTPTMAERVSADSLFFVNGNDLAGSGVFDLFGMVLQMALADTQTTSTTGMETTPVATPTVDDVYAMLEAQLGFNLKTELFDQMNGEFAMAANVDQIFSDEPVIDVVFVSGVADEATVAGVSERITFIMNSALGADATLAEREVTGGTVTSITMDPATTGGFPLAIEYGVVDGELLVGVNGGIDSYLDGSATVLADHADYQATFDVLPQENIVGVQYLSLAKLLPMIEDAATTISTSTSVMDNDEACGDYATQEEAQEAYDADTVGLWNLDLDYDGEACEDYFSTGVEVDASPASVTDSLNLISIGTVSHTDGDLYRSSTILLIGE